MSVVTYKRTIVPAVWPGDLGRAKTSAFDLQVRDSWRYVPETYEGICDWASVVKPDQEDERAVQWGGRELVYKPSVLPDDRRLSMQVVVLVLQGFLADFNISPLGNWDGRDRTAPTAVQFVTLESGGADVPFRAQVDALRNLRAYISDKVGAELFPPMDDEDSIRLERAVFTRVSASGNQRSAVPLTDVTDPGRRARKIAAQWRVDHLVQTGTRRSNGENMEVAQTSIRSGDFVEVSVYADIQLARRNKRTGSLIKFAMREVVRLWSAVDATQHFQRTDKVVADDVRGGKVKLAEMPSIFNIGEGSRSEKGEVVKAGEASNTMEVE